MRMVGIVAGALVALATGAAAQLVPNVTLTCTPSERHVCNMGSGCADAAGTTWARVQLPQGVYERCDSKAPCDRYQAVVTMSGPSINVEIPGRAAFIKVLPTGAFTEVATLGTTTIVNHGYCK
jgi:hypothetical protein